ncbi:hypothetical protein TgHK011_004850 [Trichoderma gracile]|nr:hypothetical protein TgHK011_004850 [Trichoderma gracile]
MLSPSSKPPHQPQPAGIEEPPALLLSCTTQSPIHFTHSFRRLVAISLHRPKSDFQKLHKWRRHYQSSGTPRHAPVQSPLSVPYITIMP